MRNLRPSWLTSRVPFGPPNRGPPDHYLRMTDARPRDRFVMAMRSLAHIAAPGSGDQGTQFAGDDQVFAGDDHEHRVRTPNEHGIVVDEDLIDGWHAQ